MAFLPFLLILMIFWSIARTNPVFDQSVLKQGSVINGKIDVSQNQNGITELRGDWVFWWKLFILNSKDESPDGYAKLPGSWVLAGVPDHFGFASYSLSLSGLDPDKSYAIRIGETLSACTVIANGVVEARIGTIGSSAEKERPMRGSVLARFTPHPDGTAEVILQISNFHNRTGGSNASIYVGPYNLVSRIEASQRLADVFISSVLIVLGLFFLNLFSLRSKMKSYLWFSGICIFSGIRVLCYDSFALLVLFPYISWNLFYRLGYLTFPILIICYIGFLRSFFPSLITHRLFLVIVSVFGLYSAIIVLMPEFISSSILIFFLYMTIFVILGGFFTLIIACIRRLPYSRWFLVSFSFGIGFYIYDTLVSMWVVSGYFFGQIGVSLSLFCIALFVVESYTSSFERNRFLSEKLQAMNKSLRRFVPEEFLACLSKDSPTDIKFGESVEMNMAVMSSDIRSFSLIAEKMQPSEVFSYLNEYLALVGPIIRENGGFIARYEGDGFLALYPNGADSAVRAAVQMQSAITGWNRRHPGRYQLTVGIGIDSGKLAMGAVGDTSRMNGTLLSGSAKSAAKLEFATKELQARILISDAVFIELHDPLAWFLRPVERIQIGERTAVLFEVYNNDPEVIRNLKWKTQNDLEKALLAFFAGRFDESKIFINRILPVLPDDPVVKHYVHRLNL
jgi:class 3 adenylate cyclase